MLTKMPPPPPRRAGISPKPTITRTWADVLRDAGYPTNVIVLDFETYFDSDYSMRSMSTLDYITDNRFEAISVADTWMTPAFAEDYRFNTAFTHGEDVVAKRIRHLAQCVDNCTWLIQNAKFDASVLAHKYGVYPKYVVDLLGIARALHPRAKNGLGALCERYKLEAKGETANFSGATFRTNRFIPGKSRKRGPKMPIAVPAMSAEKLAELEVYNRGDNYREWELFTLMLPQLQNAPTELRLMQHSLELFTKPVLRCDFDHGAKLVDAMEIRIAKSIPHGCTHDEISGNLSFEHLLNEALIAAGDVPGAYHKWGAKGAAYALAKTDPEREKLLAHPDARVRDLMQARTAIKSWPNHISRVKNIMAMAKACDGAMPVPLRYWGAHTGRWSGEEDINLQNMAKQGDPLLIAIRGLLIAPPGMMLVIADASAIEARVLAWIAGEWWLVDKFAANAEVYCDLAMKITGLKGLRKPKRKGMFIPQVEDKMEQLRGLGKVGVLGCGYGMGKQRALDYANGSPYNLGITQTMADKIVDTYRAENKAIVAFWSDIEKAFSYVVRYRRPCDLPRGLRFDPYSDTGVSITLPNGRELRYESCRIVPDPKRNGRDSLRIFNPIEHTWEHVWGGHLTENVVQAISRDILAEALLRLEDLGHHTAHHIHDELVIVAKQQDAADVLKVAEQEIGRTPAWAPRMALAAEGVLSERYGKH